MLPVSPMKTIPMGSFYSLIGMPVMGLIFFALVGISSLKANPIDVSYTISGTTGDYYLDFTVTNNLNAGQLVYFFGIQSSDAVVTGSPTGFASLGSTPWSNAANGGSNLVYNLSWQDGDSDVLGFGQTLSGFTVHSTDLVAPDSVAWFAYGHNRIPGDDYLGGDNFYLTYNPGFEGSASAVSESGSIFMMLGSAFFVLTAIRRRLACEALAHANRAPSSPRHR